VEVARRQDGSHAHALARLQATWGSDVDPGISARRSMDCRDSKRAFSYRIYERIDLIFCDT
jgi:hypothetical protein